MSLLQDIIEEKKAEVERLALRVSRETLQAEAAVLGQPRGFALALSRAIAPAIIAEIKRASPSKGMIRPELDPVATALTYARAGASCISVLTDEKFFGGSPEYLPAINAAFAHSEQTAVPLLRKDFIIDPLQIWQSRAIGADAILLITAALDPATLEALAREARSASLDVLFEVHTEAELAITISVLTSVFGEEGGLSSCMLGINNRDLHTFVTDLEVTRTLAKLAKEALSKSARFKDTAIVTESGISSAGDMHTLSGYGANAFLIGEALVAAGDPGENLSRLLTNYR